MVATDSLPLVSVIIPAYNAERYIADAIESVLNQSYQIFELIIIDDCSKDGTWEIIQDFKKRDKRIRAYRNKENLGIGGNRNKGIKLAKGEYIAWQDSDDISLPTRLKLQVDYLVEHEDVGAVGGWIEFFGMGIKPSVRKYNEHDTQLRRTIFRYNPIAQPAAMFRAKCYETLGLYHISYTVTEDLEMLFRLGTRYEFANVQSIVLRYRQDANSLTRKNLKKMEKTTLQLRFKYARDNAYGPTLGDYIYNIAQYISMFVLPAKVKIQLFNFLRNAKA